MNRLFGIIVLWLVTSVALCADDVVQFDDETYIKKNEVQNDVFQLAEYIRSKDNLKQWYKLIAVRNFMGLSDPKAAANGLAKEVVAQNKNAKPQVFTNTATGETAIVFVTYPANLEFVEFNVFRYRKCSTCVGLVSYQFASRIYDGEITEQVKKDFTSSQSHWRNEFLKMDIKYPFAK